MKLKLILYRRPETGDRPQRGVMAAPAMGALARKRHSRDGQVSNRGVSIFRLSIRYV